MQEITVTSYRQSVQTADVDSADCGVRKPAASRSGLGATGAAATFPNLKNLAGDSCNAAILNPPGLKTRRMLRTPGMAANKIAPTSINTLYQRFEKIPPQYPCGLQAINA